MIKLTNSQASSLLSPEARNLFQKDFPVKTTFLLLDLVQSIEERLKTYHQQYREIVKKYEGEVKNNGLIVYPNDTQRVNAKEKLSELSSVTLEYNFEKIEIADDWPKLSIQEAAILKPLIKGKPDA